jgi:ribosomal protein S14
MRVLARKRMFLEIPKRAAVKRPEKLQRLLYFVASTCDSPENALRLQLRITRQRHGAQRANCKSFCSMTGRGHSVYRHFRLSRSMVRELAHRGQIYGLRKASWLALPALPPSGTARWPPTPGAIGAPPPFGPRRPPASGRWDPWEPPPPPREGPGPAPPDGGEVRTPKGSGGWVWTPENREGTVYGDPRHRPSPPSPPSPPFPPSPLPSIPSIPPVPLTIPSPCSGPSPSEANWATHRATPSAGGSPA